MGEEGLEDDDLEAPDSVEQLYLARGDEVNPARPIMTGDVFSGVSAPAIPPRPGQDPTPYSVIVLTHPCSMRRDGVALNDYQVVAEVSAFEKVKLAKWPTSHFRRMPLPELDFTDHFAAEFGRFGLVESTQLRTERRTACLSVKGINLLQQRWIFDVCRCAVPTWKLHQTCEAVFVETDLCEEWLERRAGDCSNEANVASETGKFHEWIRSSDGDARPRQDRLRDAQHRAGVTAEMRRYLKSGS